MKPRARSGSAANAGDAVSHATTTKYHPTPLVAPAVCSVVLIPPSGDDGSRKSPRMQSTCRRRTDLLLAAAEAVAVPVFVCCRERGVESEDCPHRTFACGAHGCIWKNDAFTKALDAEDCTTLVLAGYWFDREILVAALYALADRYEVYVPVDASPAQSKEAARLAGARLLRAGGTPVLTKQILHEWMIETPSAEMQAALQALLK